MCYGTSLLHFVAIGTTLLFIAYPQLINSLSLSSWNASPLSRNSGAYNVQTQPREAQILVPEFVRDAPLSEGLTNPLLGLYVPKNLEVCASTWNTLIHGIYELYTPPGSGTPGNRPVYKRMSRPELFMSWKPDPKPRWIIGEQIANMGNPVIPYAELHSSSFIPAFSKGWYVQPERPNGSPAQMPLDMSKLKGETAFVGQTDNPQVNGGAVNAAMMAPQAHQLIPGLAGGNENFITPPQLINRAAKISLKFDKEVICDEARPDTFSHHVDGIVGKGCTVSSSGRNKCNPPRASRPGASQPVLDFTMYGADSLLNNTLLSFGGYFLKRPYYEFRSALNPNPQHGISELNGKATFLWAEGISDRGMSPTWYITRELGNKNTDQMLLVWKARTNMAAKTPANYPAQPHLELSETDWKLPIRMMSNKNLENNFGADDQKHERVNIRIRGLPLLRNSFVVVRDSPLNLVGEYYLVGEYMGYPFYRQDRTATRLGYSLFRGFVLAADKDAWVIGAKLGSSEGIHAYAEDSHARVPGFIKSRWIVWDNSQWTVSSMYVLDNAPSNP